MIVHCLFEQTGTFKNAFKKYGIEAYDYDIQNEIGETDYVTELIKEIEQGYKGEPSLFDKISPDDLIFAFFPCVRFEDQIMLHFRCQCSTQRNWSEEQKLEYTIKMQEELTELYLLISKMTIVCLRKGLHMIIENPYSAQHYLKQYWCIRPKLIDKDRTKNGDSMKKPTQFFFINCEPKNNFIFEPLDYVEAISFKKLKGNENVSRKTARSMMHPQYADRFIRQYILDEEIWRKQ